MDNKDTHNSMTTSGRLVDSTYKRVSIAQDYVRVQGATITVMPTQEEVLSTMPYVDAYEFLLLRLSDLTDTLSRHRDAQHEQRMKNIGDSQSDMSNILRQLADDHRVVMKAQDLNFFMVIGLYK